MGDFKGEVDTLRRMNLGLKVTRISVSRVAFVAALVLACPAFGKDFRAGPLQGYFDVTLSYGAIYRVEDSDDALVGIGNGGESLDANADDGTLNYDRGLVSNMAAFNTELTLEYENFGVFVKTIGFYDWEQEEGDRKHRRFDERALDRIGSDVEVRDFFLSGKFSWGGLPWHIRVGDQVINWGESTFIREGVDVINPVDGIAALQPARSKRDARVPQGMLWAAANVTETFSVEAFYQYDWQGVTLPAIGAFFSTNDLVSVSATGFAQLNGGQFSDLGTDLDGAFGLPAGTLGIDPAFLQVPERGRELPRDSGQFGAGILAITRGANALKFGFHYIRYHSRLPLIGGLTADAGSIALTDPMVVDNAANALVPTFAATGLDAVAAQNAADRTAASLALSGYANAAGYYTEYPEGIDMFAATFNTATLRTGTLVSAEISHHRNYPFQLSIGDVFNAVLSPVLFDDKFAAGTLGEYGADQRVEGFTRLDRTQLAVSFTQLLGPRLGAAQMVLLLDGAYIHVHGMPGRGEPGLNAPGGGDADSWGYRLVGQLEYASVFGGLNLLPRIGFVHDVDGFSPAPVATFREDRKAFLVGLRGEFINRFVVDMGYTRFFGGGETNNLIDRDFIQLRFGVGF